MQPNVILLISWSFFLYFSSFSPSFEIDILSRLCFPSPTSIKNKVLPLMTCFSHSTAPPQINFSLCLNITSSLFTTFPSLWISLAYVISMLLRVHTEHTTSHPLPVHTAATGTLFRHLEISLPDHAWWQGNVYGYVLFTSAGNAPKELYNLHSW